MFEKTLDTSEHPQIKVTMCAGDLSVQGEATQQVCVQMPEDEGQLSISQEEELILVEATEDCRITCPAGATLTIDTVHGDLKVKAIEGTVTVGTVHGDMRLRDTGRATMSTIHGDLSARRIEGDLTVDTVAGDARAEHVEGRAVLSSVGSDLHAEDVEGGLEATVGSDVKLSPPFEPGAVYRVTTGSDLLVRIPKTASLQFKFCVGGEVDSTVAGLSYKEEGGEVSGSFGEAENPALLEASVGSDVALRSAEGHDTSYDDFGVTVGVMDSLKGLEQIGTVVAAKVAEAMAGLEVGLREGLRQIDGERIREQVEREVARAQEIAEEAAQRATERMQHAAERVRQVAERETERARREAEREAEQARREAEQARREAEREAEQARREAEREAERARMRAEGAERRWQRASGRPEPEPRPAPEARPEPAPAQPSESAARDERMRILQMLEEGKVSVEEAAALLSAIR